MTAEDLPVAILRHATSKIKTAEDLAAIGTLGFRGEALAAISAVSEMRIISKTREAESGVMLTASGGTVVDICEVGAVDGTTVVVENLFETRYKFAAELKRMGADITVRNRTAVIRGVDKLHGAKVTAGDLRGGAALVLAALVADGETTVLDLSHIDRGYADFEYKLKKLGAKIRRIRV
jgi:5-enolpyruvylshikimate-3-phosphate synthase